VVEVGTEGFSKGKAKEAAGKITGNPRLKVEGKLDQGKGKLRQAGEKVKNAVLLRRAGHL
jgi:uncharacterized protein YjbJ (UPF0337 family)